MDSLAVIDEMHKLNFEELTLLYRLYFRETKQIDLRFAPSLEKKGLVQRADNELGWEIPKGLIGDFDGSAIELNEMWHYKNEAAVNERIKQENRNRNND